MADVRGSKYLQTMPPRRLWRLFLAIFFAFCPLGLFIDLVSEGRLPLWQLIFWPVFSGLTAVGYTVAAVRDPKRSIPAVMIVQLAVTLLVPQFGGHPAAPQLTTFRIIADASAMLAAIMLSYTFFLDFIVREGVSHVAYQAEMSLARRMQETLVPAIVFRNGWFEAYGRSAPSADVGGDLIDLVPQGREAVAYVVDVSGHGVAAGMLMGMIKAMARQGLPDAGGLRSWLNRLNAALPGLKPPQMYATFAGVRLTEGSSEVEYALAGHLPILHYRKQAGAVAQLSLEQFPLGMFAQATFQSGLAMAGPGDVLAILTDGLVEVEGAAGEELGLERITRLLGEHAAEPLEQLAEALMRAASAHGIQSDDQSLLLVRLLG